ncbi:hypothetical protein DMENIID0001_093090 [Sergentomyia squamirostris]
MVNVGGNLFIPREMLTSDRGGRDFGHHLCVTVEGLTAVNQGVNSVEAQEGVDKEPKTGVCSRGGFVLRLLKKAWTKMRGSETSEDAEDSHDMYECKSYP